MSNDDNSRISVMAIYPTRGSIEVAVDRLRQAGFRNEDVSVLMPRGDSNKEFGHEKDSKMPEGTSVGATTGAVLGGTLGWLAGVGTLALAGLGPLVAAGPIMAALAGVGTGSVSAVSQEASLDWVSRNTRPSVTKAGSRTVEFCCRFTVTTANGRIARKIFSRRAAART